MTSLNLPAPTFTSYIPPTTPPLAQFTPAPTCYPTTVGQQMWHVTGLCYPYAPNGNPNKVPLPVCTYTRAGNPQENKPECGNRWGVVDPKIGIIGSCPKGFTSAGVDQGYGSKPFDRTTWQPTHSVQSFDATASAVVCCPSISGLSFKARTTGMGNVYTQTTTVHNGVLFTMDVPVPHCYAHPVTALDSKTVTMGVYHDNRVFDRKIKREEEELKKRQGWPWDTPGWGGWGDMGTKTTAVFNARRDTIWADEVRYHYTVFHGTHTCYENCHDYFTNSYYNTDPNFTPPPATTTSEPTSSPPAAQTSSSHPSAGFPYPSGGGRGDYYNGGSPPPYPTTGPGKGNNPYPPAHNGDQYAPGEGNGNGNGEGKHTNYPGNQPPVYSAKPAVQSSVTTTLPVQASGVRLGGLAVWSALAAGFLGLTLAL